MEEPSAGEGASCNAMKAASSNAMEEPNSHEMEEPSSHEPSEAGRGYAKGSTNTVGVGPKVAAPEQ